MEKYLVPEGVGEGDLSEQWKREFTLFMKELRTQKLSWPCCCGGRSARQ